MPRFLQNAEYMQVCIQCLVMMTMDKHLQKGGIRATLFPRRKGRDTPGLGFSPPFSQKRLRQGSWDRTPRMAFASCSGAATGSVGRRASSASVHRKLKMLLHCQLNTETHPPHTPHTPHTNYTCAKTQLPVLHICTLTPCFI